MTLEHKKEHIIRCLKLGMSLYSACLIAECEPEEITLIENDKEFSLKVEQVNAIAEYELLIKHNIALEISKNRGNASAIQWKLEKINPERWNSKDKELPYNINGELTINLTGKAVDNNKEKE